MNKRKLPFMVSLITFILRGVFYVYIIYIYIFFINAKHDIAVIVSENY